MSLDEFRSEEICRRQYGRDELVVNKWRMDEKWVFIYGKLLIIKV